MRIFRLDRFSIADDAALVALAVIGTVFVCRLLLPLVTAAHIATATTAAARVIVGRRNVAELRAGPAGQPGQSVPRRRRLPVRVSRPAGRLLRPSHITYS